MAKKRYINTKFWDDNYVVNLDPIEKLMFLYFITNPLTDICGIYEIPLRRMAFDTGIDKYMILKIIERFEEDDKIYYIDGWIYVKNFSKNQIINDSVQKGIERSLLVVPKEIIDRINIIEQSGDRVVADCDIPKPKPELIYNSDKSPINYKDLVKGMGIPSKPVNTQQWQEQALEVIKGLNVPENKVSSVFKCFKDNPQKAKTAWLDCKELGKLNVLYFLKVYNIISKKTCG
jgi:hypothetical protein